MNRTTGLDRIKDECRRTVVRRHSSFSKALATNNPATTAEHNPKRASNRITPTGERSPGTLPARRNVTAGAAPTRSRFQRNHRLRTANRNRKHRTSSIRYGHEPRTASRPTIQALFPGLQYSPSIPARTEHETFPYTVTCQTTELPSERFLAPYPQPVNLPKNSAVFRTNAPYRSAISRTGTARTQPGFSPTAVPPDSKSAESTAISSGHAKETYPAKQGFAPARHRELNPSCRPGTEEIRSPRITKARTNGSSVRKSRSGKPAACCS